MPDANGWIRCATKPPKFGKRVLVFYRGEPWTAKLEGLSHGHLWFLPTGTAERSEITFWQPLPAPPVERGSKEK